MRMLVLLTVGLAASGCHAPCGGCNGFETCEPMATACTLNNGATFDVIAASGEVSTNGRNLLTDGVPNPDLCVDLGSGAQCSGPRTQTYDPTWNATLYSAVPGSTLLTTSVNVSYIDRGLIHDVSICSATVSISEQYLHEGAFRLDCNNGSYAQITLKNVSRGTSPLLDGGSSD